ncbi:hypothetical protein [Cochleicola gelatinilyticus]|uniref:Uncharacterized protein n=1 Tax=Cochleicola gelatinilyticus TaxID=1763537 RepID=A0A167HMN5_9FLAO|nr:hypothetical protein [Cochleicola gelatinilyticus]OAB78776.1 hypothetical protein ULVI_09345 [Cochleicola gelatinilyticus]
MACNNKLTSDILQSCDDLPKKGLANNKAVIVNVSDVDWSSTTSSGATVTSLTLKSGNTGYKLEDFKDLASTNSSFAPNAEDVDGFTHSWLSRILTTKAEDAESANQLKNGRFIMVVETNYGRGTTNSYKVYGFENGLKLAEMTNGSKDNSGAILYTLTSEEGTVEQYPFMILNEGDYATTTASYEALFAEV